MTSNPYRADFDGNQRVRRHNSQLFPLNLNTYFNPYPADHDHCSFYSVSFVNQVNVIENEMSV